MSHRSPLTSKVLPSGNCRTVTAFPEIPSTQVVMWLVLRGVRGRTQAWSHHLWTASSWHRYASSQEFIHSKFSIFILVSQSVLHIVQRVHTVQAFMILAGPHTYLTRSGGCSVQANIKCLTLSGSRRNTFGVHSLAEKAGAPRSVFQGPEPPHQASLSAPPQS